MKSVGQKNTEHDRSERWLKQPSTASGLRLTFYLNSQAESEDPGRQKILSFLQDMRELQHLIETSPESIPEWQSAEIEGSNIMVRRDDEWPGLELHRKIESALSKYSPRLRIQIPSRTDPQIRSIVAPETDEADAATALVALSEAGKLSLVRQCEGCRQWIYVQTSNKKTCDENCRGRKYRNTDRFKEDRRLYMQIRYWETESKDLLSKIRNLSRSREDQEAKVGLEATRSEIKAKIEQIKKSREQLNEAAKRGGIHGSL